MLDPDASALPPRASDTLNGPTSADLHAGLGHPGSGMTSAELRHDGKSHRKREGGNVQQYGRQGGDLDGVNSREAEEGLKGLKEE